MELMPTALLITVIGMGLVFIALLLLWGMMELMMRVSARFARPEGEEETAEEEAAPEPVAAAGDRSLKLRAAAAAVAVAEAVAPATAGGYKPRAAAAAVAVLLANQQPIQPAPEQDEHELITAWQAVLRSNRLSRQASMYSRKQRGTVR